MKQFIFLIAITFVVIGACLGAITLVQSIANTDDNSPSLTSGFVTMPQPTAFTQTSDSISTLGSNRNIIEDEVMLIIPIA